MDIKPFLTDIQKNSDYGFSRHAVDNLLNESLTAEIMYVLRYWRSHFITKRLYTQGIGHSEY